MSSAKNRLKSRRRAKGLVEQIFAEPKTVNFIHYSCESFYDNPQGSSRRITSIAVFHLGSGQVQSFSIHQIAEQERGKISLDDIEQHYDELEKSMLKRFYEFVRLHKNYTWVHWNMRDTNYGFPAIAHRFESLGGQPEEISDDHKIDLPALFDDIYGADFANDPQLLDMMTLNGKKYKEVLSGAEEANAFKNKEYILLHQSTLRKVRLIWKLAKRQWEGKLVTRANLWQRHGATPAGLVDDWTDHWIYKVLGGIGIVATLYCLF